MPYCRTSFLILKYHFLIIRKHWVWHKPKHVSYGRLLKKCESFWSCANYLWSVIWVMLVLSSWRINSKWKNRVSQNACGGHQPKRETKKVWAFLWTCVPVIDMAKLRDTVANYSDLLSSTWCLCHISEVR